MKFVRIFTNLAFSTGLFYFAYLILPLDVFSLMNTRSGFQIQFAQNSLLALLIAVVAAAILSLAIAFYFFKDGRKVEYPLSKKPTGEKSVYYRTLQGEVMLKFWYLWLLVILSGGFAYYSSTPISANNPKLKTWTLRFP